MNKIDEFRCKIDKPVIVFVSRRITCNTSESNYPVKIMWKLCGNYVKIMFLSLVVHYCL